MKSRITILLLLASLCIARAAIFSFDISPPGTDNAVGLSGANEVPTNPGTSASGNEILGGITYDTVTLLLTLNIGYGSGFGFNDLTGDFSAAHIHLGATGVDGGVIFGLGGNHTPVGTRSGSFTGTVQYDSGTEPDLLNNLHYINIHSAAFGGGEIRGQLVAVPEPSTYGSCAGLALLALVGYRTYRDHKSHGARL